MTVGSSLRHGVTTRSQCPTGAFPETRLPSCLWNTARSSSARRALAGCGADCDGDAAPGVAPRGALRQVQHQSAHRPLDPDG